MSTHIKQKNCPCSKGEYCTNGLKCTERNCFLLKGSTFVARSLAVPIESLNPPISILTSDYRQSKSIYLNIRGSDDSTPNMGDGLTELNYALKQK
jgi:hypothetical protein